MATEKKDKPLIYQNMVEISRRIGAVAKIEYNSNQQFNFRGIDSVYNALHSIMADVGVFTMPIVLNSVSEERKSRQGGALIYRILTMQYTFYASDGSSVEAVVVGEGMDPGDKAANKSMAVAHKYALLQAFCVPTKEAKDPDAESYEVESKNSPAQEKPKQKSKPKSTFDGVAPGDYELTFGKHKGLKLSEAPTGYVRWLAKNGEEKYDSTQAARSLLEQHSDTIRDHIQQDIGSPDDYDRDMPLPDDDDMPF